MIFDFAFERIMDMLNASKRSTELPDELKGIYDEGKYKKSQEYENETGRFSLITSTFSFILIMVFLFFNGFAYVDNIARGAAEHPIVIALVFFGILWIVSDIINTPFSLYSVFKIEEKYGFNKTTLKTFFLDKLKGWLLGILIGGGLFSLIMWIYMAQPDMFWLLAWGVSSGFMIFMAMFYSSLIVPLFNKQTPLEEGSLRAAIQNFSKKTNFKLNNVFVIDGSKRSTKANAYFSGLGAKKRIVLYDTLINDLEEEEIVGVLAHEIGHYKLKHTRTGIILSVFQSGVMFYILSLFISNPALSEALGATQHSFHLAIITFFILYSPLSSILGLGMNVISRKNEYAADNFASTHYDNKYLISALKKLSVKNLSNLTPHPAYVFVHYSHPTLLQRIKAFV